ncbi:MAG: S41 family peptidase [Planctomycetota bacterium]
MTRRQFLSLIVPLLAVLLGFVVLIALERSGPPGALPWDEEFADQIRWRMGHDFVWGIEDGRKAWEAYFNGLNAYVATFDPFAEVIPPWQVEATREESSGQYTGIGIRIAEPTGSGPVESIRITGVKPDGPAAEAGIAVGEEILAVDDHPIPELLPEPTLRPLQRAIRGPEGTVVTLRVRDAAGARRDVRVTRKQIDTGSVFGTRMVDAPHGIGYTRLGGFQANTARDTRQEIRRLLDEGMRALVLDLRLNRGGLMDQAVEVADLFLDSGVIVRQRGRIRDFTDTHEAGPEGTLSDTLPLAVLVNRESASASEILAAALRDHRRAVLVGEPTYGKFLVQMVEEVPMEIGIALFKRTTSIYETPLGHHYQRTVRGHAADPLAGIVPDVRVPLTKEDRKHLLAQYDFEFYSDWNGAIEVPADWVDPQLEAAAAVLRGETYYPKMAAEPEE